MEISFVNWDDAQSALRHIRQKVFIEEQHVPEELEWDAVDKTAKHILGKEGNRPVACARITLDGKLGRLAVLKDYRKNGWGSRLLRGAEEYLLQKHQKKIFLNSQANSYYFYFLNGYRPTETMFWDANIPHIRMEKTLGRPNPTNNTFLLGLDGETYSSEQPAACPAWMQIASSQCRRGIDIEIKDLSHPVFNNSFCLDNLSAFIRQSQRTCIRVLLHEEIAGLAEHPLMLVHQRISSRFLVRRTESLSVRERPKNHFLFDDKGHIQFDLKSTTCNFNNAASVKKQKMKFEEQWHRSMPLIEGRKLRI